MVTFSNISNLKLNIQITKNVFPQNITLLEPVRGCLGVERVEGMNSGQCQWRYRSKLQNIALHKFLLKASYLVSMSKYIRGLQLSEYDVDPNLSSEGG